MAAPAQLRLACRLVQRAIRTHVKVGRPRATAAARALNTKSSRHSTATFTLGAAALGSALLGGSESSECSSSSAEKDRIRWDARHRCTQTPRVAAPMLPPDVDAEEVLPRAGRALDVACGTGGVSIWLAQRGLEVTALDISPVALAVLESEAQKRALQVEAATADCMPGLPSHLGPASAVCADKEPRIYQLICCS